MKVNIKAGTSREKPLQDGTILFNTHNTFNSNNN